MAAEDQFLDVLQNIEFVIMKVYHEHPDLTDSMVDVAIEGLVRAYTAEQRDRPVPALRLAERSQEVFDAVKSMCDWRLGRADDYMQKEEDGEPVDFKPSNTVDDIILCLKRIRKSIKLWTKEYGRQGYLNFVSQFFLSK